MRISLRWLSEFIDIQDFFSAPLELADLLTRSGLEVENIDDQAKSFKSVVIGHILDKKPHPDADRLTLCQVSTGSGLVHQIVCGATNHNQNDRVVVALPGAHLPCGLQIKRSKIRGVVSDGMLCSEKELGLSHESLGIMILPQDAPIGHLFSDYMSINDITIEIKVTPNRADCLSHLGLARELSTLLGREYKLSKPQFETIKTPPGVMLSASIENSELCPRYAGRIMKGVTVKESPDWLKKRLKSVGLKSINNIVDATNYVMMELGQPLHAFDLTNISDHKIKIGLAKKGETLITLDGTELEFQGNEVVIRDQEKIVALAGIIGGLTSGIKPNTTSIFIESAYFLPSSIRKSSRKFGIETDSSYRFSRGVDPDFVIKSLDLACELILKVSQGEVLDTLIDIYNKPIEKSQIEVSLSHMEECLGYKIPEESFIQWIKKLGCQIEASSNGLKILPPLFRTDLLQEVDLIEEYARLSGYEHIPEKLPILDKEPSQNETSFFNEKRILNQVKSQGFNQAVNFTFLDKESQISTWDNDWAPNGLHLDGEPISIENPLSEEQRWMRGSLIPGLLKNFSHNYRHGNLYGNLFELGYVFFRKEETYTQSYRLAFISWGKKESLWSTKSPAILELKAKLENVLKGIGLKEWSWSINTKNLTSIMHPGQSANIMIQSNVIGYITQVHPQYIENLKFKADCVISEINLDKLIYNQLKPTKIKNYSIYPFIQRDLAFTMPKNLPAGNLINEIKKTGGAFLQSIEIFDLYEGESLNKGQKSVAYRLTFQNSEETLTDDQIMVLQNLIIDQIRHKFSVEVR